jgi:prepilin-type N-terminal cleavage/methylation domain-containing protein
MRMLPRARRSVSASDAGFTLVELLVASAAALIVTGALVTLLSSVLHSQPEAQARSGQIQDGRVVLERMVREVRQGSIVVGTSSTARSLTIDTYTRGGCNGSAVVATAVRCRVVYTCTANAAGLGTCTRKAGTETPTQIVTGLSSPDVFAYAAAGTTSASCNLLTTTSPALVCINLVYPASASEDTVDLRDGAFLRNTS